MSDFLKFNKIKCVALFAAMSCLAGANEVYCYSIEEAARLVFPGIQGKTFSEMNANDFGQTCGGVNLKDSFRNFNALCYIAAAETSGYHYIICDKEYIPEELKKCYELLSGSREPVGIESSDPKIKEWDGYTTYNRMVFSPKEANELVNKPAVMNALMLLETMLGERSEMYSIFHFKRYRENKKGECCEYDLKFYTEKWKSAEIIGKYQNDLLEKLKNGQLIKNSIFINNNNDFAKIKTKNSNQRNNYKVAVIGNDVTKIPDYAFKGGYHSGNLHFMGDPNRINLSGATFNDRRITNDELRRDWTYVYNFSKILMGEGTKLKETEEDSFVCDSELKELVLPHFVEKKSFSESDFSHLKKVHFNILGQTFREDTIPVKRVLPTEKKDFYPKVEIPRTPNNLKVNSTLGRVRWMLSWFNFNITIYGNNIFYPIFPDLENLINDIRNKIENASQENKFDEFGGSVSLTNAFLKNWIKEKISTESDSYFIEDSLPEIRKILKQYDDIAWVNAVVDELEIQCGELEKIFGKIYFK